MTLKKGFLKGEREQKKNRYEMCACVCYVETNDEKIKKKWNIFFGD
jgi:hypothetical protein